MTTRNWKLILRCPADKMQIAQDTLRARFLEFVKLRKDGDIKEHVEKFEVVFITQGDEGGLAVANGDATLTHRTSVDRVSFPKLRAAIDAAIQGTAHLEEVKEKTAKPIATEVKEKEVKLETVEVKAEPLPAPVPMKEAALLPPPTPVVAPEIGVMLPELLPAPEPVKKPIPKKVQRALNTVTRANLAAARPPPLNIQAEVATPEVPQPPPAPTSSTRSFGYTVPKAAAPTQQLVFGFRK